MANTSAIRAGRALVEIFADDKPLVRGLKSAQRKLGKFGAAVRAAGLKLMGLGGMITAPLVAAAKSAAESGAALWDMAGCRGLRTRSGRNHADHDDDEDVVASPPAFANHGTGQRLYPHTQHLPEGYSQQPQLRQAA